MQYAYPELGDCLLVFGDSLTAKGIDAVEDIGMWERGEKRPKGTPTYFHTAVYVGGGKIVEALGRGLVVSPLSKYAGYADIYGIDMPDHRREQIVEQANWMCAENFRYSYWDIFVQLMSLVFRLRIPWRLKHSLICSVFVYVCYASASIKIAKHLNCSPEELALYGALKYRGRLAGGAV